MKINRSEEEISEKELPVESVLILQGGGSLGADECGVYKTLTKHSLKFDIVSGTSIGALNAAIIAAHSFDSAKSSTEKLEDFWLEFAETLISLPQQFSLLYITDGARAILASMYSAMYGNPNAFFPIWIASSFFNYLQTQPARLPCLSRRLQSVCTCSSGPPVWLIVCRAT